MAPASSAADLSTGGLAALLGPGRPPDPYPLYRQLRRDHPVWQPLEGVFVLTRHRDCAAALRHPHLGHADAGPSAARRRGRRRPLPPTSGDGRAAARSFLSMDPPDHTRLRRLVSRSFTARRVEELAPRVRALTGELLSAAVEQEAVDLVAALASPLPVTVISELLGVPPEDRERLVGWSHALARSVEPAISVPDAERVDQVRAREELATYLRELVDARRRSPGDDLVSALVGARDEGDALSEDELVGTCILLLVAGHETTTSLIANGVLALLRHPDQLARLRSDPGLVGGAVEELARYDPAVQLTMRTALEETAVAGTAVPRGAVVLAILGAANRDPEAYPDPERLDVVRPPSPHLAFGQGIHFCLGAPLARLEAGVALRALTQDVADIELVADPEWKDTAVLRGVAHLDVRLSSRGARRAP